MFRSSARLVGVLAAASLAAVALLAQGISGFAATSADMAITITGPATAPAGTNFTYLITIRNNGPDIAQGVSFTQGLPPANTMQVSFTQTSGPQPTLNVPPGTVYVFSWVLQVNPGTAAGTVLSKTVTVSAATADPNLANNTSTVTTTVAGGVGRQIVGHGAGVATTEGASFAGPTATFTDAAPGASPADYTATITWGDGTSSAGTVIAAGIGAFAIQGAHTYAEEGAYSIGSALVFPGGTIGFSSTGTVADAALHAQGVALPATRSGSFTGTIATFTDADPGGVVSDYTAVISWGDGTTSAGVVAAQGTAFKVSGSHSFGQGRFTITTSIRDVGGASATATSTLTVDLTPPVTAAAVNGTFKNGRWTAVDPATLTLTASDNLTGVAATYYSVNLGATKVYTGPVTLSTGFYGIRYWSVDGVGNVEPVKTIAIRVKHRSDDDGGEDLRGRHGNNGERGD